ncbi:MAG: hypothetical protein RLZZ142_2940, partial [Verrucomicrobiota bacterium]
HQKVIIVGEDGGGVEGAFLGLSRDEGGAVVTAGGGLFEGVEADAAFGIAFSFAVAGHAVEFEDGLDVLDEVHGGVRIDGQTRGREGGGWEGAG